MPVRVRGHRADVAPMPLFQGVSSAKWGHIVTWMSSPGHIVEIALRGGSAEETRRLAERLELPVDGARLPADALGSSTARIHREDSAHPPPGESWTVGYFGGGTRLLTISGGPATDGAVEYGALTADSTQPLEVGDLRGVSFAAFDDRAFGAILLAPGGQTVSATGLGMTRQQVAAAVGSLRGLSAEEWAALTAASDPTDDCFES